jgi:small subunit ribosomal protein S17
MAKSFVGVVASDKADKTIVVSVATRKTHPIYRKQYTSTAKFMAHDEKNDAHEGDKVTIVETKPLSKRKRFVLDRVIERAPIRHVEAVAPEVAAVIEKKTAEASAEQRTAKAAESKEEK